MFICSITKHVISQTLFAALISDYSSIYAANKLTGPFCKSSFYWVMALLTLIAYIPWIYPWIKWTYSNCKTIGELFCGVVSISFRIVKEHQPGTKCLSHGWLTINNQSETGWLFMVKNLVEPGGIEPPTPCLQSRCSPSWAMAPF